MRGIGIVISALPLRGCADTGRAAISFHFSFCFRRGITRFRYTTVRVSVTLWLTADAPEPALPVTVSV